MLSLFAISILVSSIIGIRAIQLYKEVHDKELGYEEIIAVSVLLGMCLNICIDVMNITGPVSSYYNTVKQIAVMSRLSEALISYSIVQYMFRMHLLRLGTEEK